MEIMEATPHLTYQVENNSEFRETGTVVIYTNFVTPIDISPILARSRFSCSLSIKEFIEDVESPRRQELYYFLTESGCNKFDANMLMQKLTRLAIRVTTSDEYFPHNALSLWLTFDVVPLSRESYLNNSQIEEAIHASLNDYERNIRYKSANKLGVRSLTRRIYKRKRKTSLIVDNEAKRKTSSTADCCTICLEEFKTGRKVVILPCGHEFDNKCIVKWFKVNHVCPLCRFQLPCEDDGLC